MAMIKLDAFVSFPATFYQVFITEFLPALKYFRDYRCDHSRAYQLYADSLNEVNKFYARKCLKRNGLAGCKLSRQHAYMGGEPGNIGKGIKGAYWLSTNGQSPYGKGKF